MTARVEVVIRVMFVFIEWLAERLLERVLLKVGEGR